ncbi:MAG: carbohydrate kinase family protein [Thaumarchaeota archaeon]|nr:carbohydrate kinase family protein [Nitrososphaerota archaeon]
MARAFDVAVMHDFFVDRLVHIPDLKKTVGDIQAKAAQGGGGVRGVTQSEVRGGNAVNLAHALARLGMKVLLLTHSDPEHEGLLRGAFEGLDAELRVKKASPGLTVALEEGVNVMLADPRGAGSFGPSLLDEGDWAALGRARVVCSVNWAANAKGTALLFALRRRLGRKKLVFFDPADFRSRTDEFASLLGRVGRGRTVDWLSMNEHEALAALPGAGGRDDLGQACQTLAGRLGVSFDLHGEQRTYTSDGLGVISAKVSALRPLRRTGAGDIWNAGSIYCRLSDVRPAERLSFANAAAGLYLRSRVPLGPTASQVWSSRR